MTAIDDEEDRPQGAAGRFQSRQSASPLAEEGLELMRAFQEILSRSDRDKVVALARKLAGQK
ncbi:MAG: hypothetical protein EOO82_02550 [Oxalobacteraceae bacterium]|nr:MAG: hypothetical protein EOO82_02550 [Oxalobacteraceae bacterium]